MVHLGRIGVNRQALLEVARRVVGRAISQVWYLHSDPNWPNGYRMDVDLHEPDFAVLLRLDDGFTVGIAWELIGEIETIACAVGQFTDFASDPRLKAPMSDVSSVAPYPSLLGRPVTAVEMLVSEEIPFGVRFAFDSQCVTFALGEWVGDQVTPSADSLVVSFGDI